MFNDERYEEWNMEDDDYEYDDEDYWTEEEDGWDDPVELSNREADDIEERLEALSEKIYLTRKNYDMSPVDRIVLDILEEMIDLL